MSTSENCTILPVLPGLPTEDSLCNGTRNTDLLLAVIGGLVNADDIVTHSEIDKVEATIPQILGGKESQGLEVKVKTLYHILNPTEDIKTAIEALCNNYRENGFGPMAKLNALNGLINIVVECHQMNIMAIQYLEMLYDGMELKTPDVLQRLQDIKAENMPSCTQESDGLMDMAAAWFKRNNDHAAISPLTPETRRFNNNMQEKLKRLDNWAWSFGDDELKSEIASVGSLLQDQAFKIVICGEIKQGKSSLFNAILGQDASPVDASVAATGANFKLQYSKEPGFFGQWLSKEHLTQLENYLNANKSKPIEADLSGRVEYLKSINEVVPGEEITNIQSLEDIANYISVEGEFTPLVREVTYYSPIEILKNGAVLVDTPGLNDHVAIRTAFSIEESLTADCIIFVVNAKGRRASEQEYLEKLATSGRAVNLIVVVGHIDELPKDRTGAALEYIQKWLQGVCINTSIRLVGCVPMNSKKAMELRCSGKYSTESDDTGLSTVIQLLEGILSEDAKNEIYRTKVKERFQNLLQLAEKRCLKFIHDIDSSRPDDVLINRLKSCSDILEQTCQSLYTSVRTRLRDVYIDAERMPTHYVEEVKEAKKAALDALEVAIRDRIDELGDTKFAQSENWNDFDDNIAGVIVQEAFASVSKRIADELDDWRIKLTDFERTNADEISKEVEVLKNGAMGISEACASNSQLAHAAAVINTVMKTGEKVGLGALGGVAGTAGMGSVMLTLTSITALANPVTLSISAAAIVLYGAMRFFTNIKTVKNNFIQKKINNCRDVLDEKTAEIEKDLQTTSIQIKTAFRTKAEKQYAPVIREARLLVLYNRFYLQALDKTRLSLQFYMAKISENLEGLKES